MKFPAFNKVKNTLLVISLLTSAISAFAEDYAVPDGTPAYIRSAVESPERGEQMTARDANRLPAEILTLSGVKPGDKVVEFAGFGNYYTTMLSKIVGGEGSVSMFDLPYTETILEGQFSKGSRAFVESHPNTSYTLVDYNEMTLPQDVDIVFNVLYYHDLSLNNIDTAKLNKKIYDALKPGGVFFLIDHNAKPGTGTETTQELHRIDPVVIEEEVSAAGFELVEKSDLLAHAEDDHSKMVFTPGVRGLTDRTVFKFRKPE